MSKTDRWICDICHIATFDSFDEACRHEEKCGKSATMGLKKAKQTKTNTSSAQQQQPSPAKKQIHPYFSSQQLQKSSSSADKIKAKSSKQKSVRTSKSSGKNQLKLNASKSNKKKGDVAVQKENIDKSVPEQQLLTQDATNLRTAKFAAEMREKRNLEKKRKATASSVATTTQQPMHAFFAKRGSKKEKLSSSVPLRDAPFVDLMRIPICVDSCVEVEEISLSNSAAIVTDVQSISTDETETSVFETWTHSVSPIDDETSEYNSFVFPVPSHVSSSTSTVGICKSTDLKELGTNFKAAVDSIACKEAPRTTIMPTKNLVQLNDCMESLQNQRDIGEYKEMLCGALSELCQNWEQHVKFLVNEFDTSCDFFKLLTTTSPDILQVGTCLAFISHAMRFCNNSWPSVHFYFILSNAIRGRK